MNQLGFQSKSSFHSTWNYNNCDKKQNLTSSLACTAFAQASLNIFKSPSEVIFLSASSSRLSNTAMPLVYESLACSAAALDTRSLDMALPVLGCPWVFLMLCSSGVISLLVTAARIFSGMKDSWTYRNTRTKFYCGTLISCNTGPRDWQNLLAVKRFCSTEVLFHIHVYYDWEKENRSLYPGLR